MNYSFRPTLRHLVPASKTGAPVIASCPASIRIAVALACLGLPLTSLAADAGTSGNTAITAPVGGAATLAPFQYIPSEKWKDVDASEVIARSGEPARIAEMYKAGNYAEVGTAGFALITREKVDEQLQLYIANSLAWTNRLKEAGQLYRVLIPGKYKMSAMLGLANLNRWQGRDHLSTPMYKEILAADPTNKDA